MRSLLTRLTLACLVLWSRPICLAIEVQTDSDIQKQSEAMLEKARQVSDIRAHGAPAFRLEATFSFIGDDLETIQGTFTEVWVSRSQWRRDTVVNKLHRIEVGGVDRRWLLVGDANFPTQAERVSDLIDIFPNRLTTFEFDTIRDTSEHDPLTACAVTKAAGPQKQRSAFCFDKQSGTLVEKISPEVLRTRAADYSCRYGSFRKFGDFSFPRDMDCALDGHHKMDAKITSLMLEPSPDATLFAPPLGATELGDCSVKPEAPQALSAPEPPYPLGYRGQSSTVFLSLVVNAKGKAEDVKVARTGGKSFDEEALKTVQRWTFKAATCHGQPMPIRISLQFSFQSR